jgi:hypothetical protein
MNVMVKANVTTAIERLSRASITLANAPSVKDDALMSRRYKHNALVQSTESSNSSDRASK